jgi:hypothetical protein
MMRTSDAEIKEILTPKPVIDYYVIAHSRNEMREWCKRNNVDMGRCILIYDAVQLKGIKDLPTVVVLTPLSNHMAFEIKSRNPEKIIFGNKINVSSKK